MNKNSRKNNKPFRNFFYDFAVVTGALPGLLWLRPKRIYISEKAKQPIKGGAIIVSNHVSIIDPIYLLFSIWYRRHRFVCMDELLISPAARLFFRLARCIPIDRNNMNLSSFRNITDALSAGELVTIFPEGKINETDGTVAGFKSGVILMSSISAKPIIPVYISKPKNIFSRLSVVIGESFDPIAIYGRRPRGPEINILAELLHQKELELMEKLHSNKQETRL